MSSTASTPAAAVSTPASGTDLDDCLALFSQAALLFDRSGAIERANAALHTLAGTVPARVDDVPAVLTTLMGWPGELPGAGKTLERQAWVQGQDGRQHRLQVRVRALAPGAGQPRWVAVFEDRSIEDERDLAQVEMAALMGDAEVGLATWDSAQGWVAPTAPPQRSPRKSARRAADSAVFQLVSRDLVDPESLPEYERLQRALKQFERVEVRYAVRHPDAGVRWLKTRVEPAELAPGRTVLSVMTVDVSHEESSRRRNELLLRELTAILAVSPAGIAYLRTSADAGEAPVLARCNERFALLLGLDVGATQGMTLPALLRQGGVSERLVSDALESLERAQRSEIEFHRDEAGTQRWFALALRRSRDALAGGHETVAVLTDITEARAQQAELDGLTRERELMFSLSDVGLVYQRDGRIERANQAMQVLTGLSEQVLQGMPMNELFADDADYLAHSATERRELATQGRTSSERALRRPDGALLWVLAGQRLVDVNDPRAGSICSFVSVDERRRAREQMLQQDLRTRAILDSVLVGIVTVGEDGIEWMNRSARRMFGGELAEFVGRPIAEVATEDPDHPFRVPDWHARLDEGQPETFDCQLKAYDNRRFWVVGNVVATGHLPGQRQLTFALLDVDKRRKADADIAKARTTLQRIIETAPLALALFESSGLRVLQCNAMMSRFIGHPIEWIEGRPPSQWMPQAEADSLADDLHLALQAHDPVVRALSRPADALMPATDWDVRIVSLRSSADAPAQLLLVASDVTEQRAADQARLDEAIAQREMLIKEVHHRIKNNLQGVAGLLQQNAQRHPEAAAAIYEAVGHVHAIAQVHGLQVGASGTLGPMRVRSVVEAICSSVQKMFGCVVNFSVEGQAVSHRFGLTEADSIPIALTVNELLTNAIKHGGRQEVQCRVSFVGETATIAISNPGQLRAGFKLSDVPAGISGLGLVRALLPRRGAAMSLVQQGDDVLASLCLNPPAVVLLGPL